jgi:putative ferrous iron transport protein C
MSLVEIKNHLMQVRITNLSSICHYFNADPNVLRGMLSHLMRNGCVRKCMKTPACGSSCGKCSPLLTEIYEWVPRATAE